MFLPLEAVRSTLDRLVRFSGRAPCDAPRQAGDGKAPAAGMRKGRCGAHRPTAKPDSKKIGEALRQQRGDFIRAHSDESARGDGIAASDGTAGQGGEDGQKAAVRKAGKAAAAAVGDGAFTTKTARLIAFPSDQRASDSHDYTRLATLKGSPVFQHIRAKNAVNSFCKGLIRGNPMPLTDSLYQCVLGI